MYDVIDRYLITGAMFARSSTPGGAATGLWVVPGYFHGEPVPPPPPEGTQITVERPDGTVLNALAKGVIVAPNGASYICIGDYSEADVPERSKIGW